MQEDTSLSKCGLKNPSQEKACMSGFFEGIPGAQNLLFILGFKQETRE